jgi:hypothetical protein
MIRFTWFKSVFGFSLAGLVAACGNSPFTTRASNPVIVDYQTGEWTGTEPFRYGIISTTAGRRSIFIDYNKRSGADGPRVCAEPPLLEIVIQKQRCASSHSSC